MNIAVLRRPDRTDDIRIYPGTPDPASVRVMFLNDDEQQALSDMAEVMVGQGRDREEALRIAFGRVAVKGFSGIQDGDQDLPFTEENVDYLMLNVRAFRTAVLTAATTLHRATEKNS